MSTGQVISHFGVFAIVEDTIGQLHRCRLRQNLGGAVCGDTVGWQPHATGDGVICAIHPRRNLLTRPDYRGHPKPIAANIDQIVVVVAPLPVLNEGLLDRYFVAIRALKARPYLVINKSELLSPTQQEILRAQLAPYAAMAELVFISVRCDPQLTALRERLCNQVSLLVGQSGVGKSSLVQRLLPDKAIRTAAVSIATGKGTHTTTHSTLYHLDFGGDLIDSPGVRSFELGELSLADLAGGFPEIEQASQHCRFANCRHRAEPNCGVLAAVARGEIVARRLQGYHQLCDELSRKRNAHRPLNP